MMDKQVTLIDLSEDKKNAYIELQRKYRFLFLGVIVFLEFGRYFCQELPSSLQKRIMETYDVDEASYGIFQSVYNVPNLVMPFIAGIMLDKCGRPLVLILCMGLLLVGQTLLGLSAISTISVFSIACIARFMGGIGGKNISVARTTFSSDWFMGRELSFALTISIGVSRLGVISAFALGPYLYNVGRSLASALIFGNICLLFSAICGLLAILLDQYAIIRSGYNRKAKKGKEIKLADLKYFGTKYWLTGVSITSWYLSFNCFVNISNQFAVERFGYSLQKAGFLAASIHIIAAVVCPVFGFVIDRIGRRPLFILLGSLCNVIAYVYFSILKNQMHSTFAPIPGYLLIGLGYSLFVATSWPIVTLVVGQHATGTAVGIGHCFQAIGIFFGTLIVGAISVASKDKNKQVHYLPVCLFLAASALVSAISNIVLWIIDKKEGGVLYAVNPIERMKEIQEQQMERLSA